MYLGCWAWGIGRRRRDKSRLYMRVLDFSEMYCPTPSSPSSPHSLFPSPHLCHNKEL
ncbi:hypothetical protein H1Q63_01900 [Desmonostoc muscorum CCALA 125]|nr:hypothetical protein [Desmonostoc muscorum CCALA 125]